MRLNNLLSKIQDLCVMIIGVEVLSSRSQSLKTKTTVKAEMKKLRMIKVVDHMMIKKRSKRTKPQRLRVDPMTTNKERLPKSNIHREVKTEGVEGEIDTIIMFSIEKTLILKKI